ncbi:MAG: OB-fold nucleic acid binding domain-containing protein, partial [Thermoguttaceae bacterium]|nr:OB-fold nucleic acid binding domain-containing protein [Thermoguttaceae bacterium]
MRRFIQQFCDQESVHQIFRINDKILRTNRNGNLYLQCDLSDRTGRLPARLWNATESNTRGYDNGDYVYVEGTTQIFQGSMQLIATKITKADMTKVDEE